MCYQEVIQISIDRILFSQDASLGSIVQRFQTFNFIAKLNIPITCALNVFTIVSNV